MKNEDLLLELLKEVREDQKDHGKTLSKQSEELVRQSACLDSVQKDMKEVKVDLSKNTADVAEHVRRSNLLEDLHKDNEKRLMKLEDESKKKDERLEKLEAPEKAKAWLKKNYLAAGSIIISILSIITMLAKIIGLF